jgi:hypothetical protein
MGISVGTGSAVGASVAATSVAGESETPAAPLSALLLPPQPLIIHARITIPANMMILCVVENFMFMVIPCVKNCDIKSR